MSRSLSCGALGAALATLPAAAFAQVTLKEVTVTGNPLGTNELVAPSAQLSGTQLLLRSQSTLGETLSQTPGVSSTYFGPNASRPVVRGLDGDRVRMMSNGAGALDASSVSYDHAVAIDPIAVERIEVLRGPAALLYGGNAIGGAVNVIDNRIPQEAANGVGGRAELGAATGNRERSGAAMVEGSNGRIGLHADVFDRRASDVRVPAALACTKGGSLAVASRICNSASHTRGGAAGGSVFFEGGYLGLSAATYRNDYGTVAEDEVTIGMRSDHYALEGEWRKLPGPFASLKLQASQAAYRHTEFESAVPGTTFRNDGGELRVEARQAKWGALDGVVGVQVNGNRFSADGAEAFAPHSRTRQQALFAYQELATAWGKLSFGARAEQVRVESLGSPSSARFAAGERSFSPRSAALGALWKLAPEWQLTANLAHSERAPKDYELYANGPHLATAAWETGDATLGKERSLNLDAGVQWKRGRDSLRVNAFTSRFSNYIALASTGGTQVTDDGDVLPQFVYGATRARFRGLEVAGNFRLQDAASTLDLELRGDVVRADNLATGEPLPRIAPARVGATLAWAQGAWGARLGFDHTTRQGRVPSGDLSTPAHTLWSAAATYRMTAGAATLLWFARLDNATDRLAYSASSILTQTAPGKAPLPGRSLKLGLQATF